MMKKYTTILFDADNTLFDFDKAESVAVSKVLSSLGVNVTPAIVKRYSEINLQYWKKFERGEITKSYLCKARFGDLFDEIGFVSPCPLEDITDKYLGELKKQPFLLQNAKEICQALKNKGYDLYIITNGVAETQKSRLKVSGIADFFTDVFISEELGVQKPKKEFFDFSLSKCAEKDKSKILVVGDSYTSDILGACNNSLDCVWLNINREVNPLELDITYQITALSELLCIL